MEVRIPFLTSPLELPTHAEILDGAPCYESIFAISNDITAGWVKAAYQNGLFPWYSEGEPVLWHSPNPRMVLQIDQFKCSPSLKKKLRQWARRPADANEMSVTLNRDFVAVIANCALTEREGQSGTWITPELARAYTDLHLAQQAVSVEVWRGETLVAGLYGVMLGKMFFGESMFTHISDGSKAALACLVEYLRKEDFQLIDCQQETGHLTRLGGSPIAREKFFKISAQLMQQTPPDWNKMVLQENLLQLFL